MSRSVSLCRDPGTLVKCNKSQLCDYMTTEPARLAENFQSNHACKAAPRMNQARNRTASNILLMRAASNLYINMAAVGWPG